MSSKRTARVATLATAAIAATCLAGGTLQAGAWSVAQLGVIGATAASYGPAYPGYFPARAAAAGLPGASPWDAAANLWVGAWLAATGGWGHYECADWNR